MFLFQKSCRPKKDGKDMRRCSRYLGGGGSFFIIIIEKGYHGNSEVEVTFRKSYDAQVLIRSKFVWT